MQLKYLFIAYYKDGTSYSQTEEDISVSDSTRSCFFDVKQDELIKFELVGNGHTHSVDLIDGHFEIDGVPFFIHEENLSNFRIVFFRRHRHVFNQASGEEMSHIVTYRIGWQCTVNEKNHQRILEIS